MLREIVTPPEKRKNSFFEKLEKFNDGLHHITFTSLVKVGLNPQTKFDTPIAVCCYPIDDVILKQFKNDSLPYAGDSRYVSILKQKGDGVWTAQDSAFEELMVSSFDKVVKIFRDEYQIDPEIIDQILSDAKAGARKLSNIDKEVSQLWNFIRLGLRLSARSGKTQIKPAIRWNSILRRLGINGIVDQGSGLLHPHEKFQTMFFTPDAYEVVQTFDNPHDAYLKYKKNISLTRYQPEEERQKINLISNIIDNIKRSPNPFKTFNSDYFLNSIDSLSNYSYKTQKGINKLNELKSFLKRLYTWAIKNREKRKEEKFQTINSWVNKIENILDAIPESFMRDLNILYNNSPALKYFTKLNNDRNLIVQAIVYNNNFMMFAQVLEWTAYFARAEMLHKSKEFANLNLLVDNISDLLRYSPEMREDFRDYIEDSNCEKNIKNAIAAINNNLGLSRSSSKQSRKSEPQRVANNKIAKFLDLDKWK